MALKNKKQKNFSEWYTELVGETGANLADIRYGIQGAIVETPWAVKIIRAFEGLIEKEVEADGHEPMLFPSIVPEEYLNREKAHIKGFAPELYWITEGGGKKLDEKFYLRPTGESQIFPMYSLWVRGWKDLPLKRYQSRITVFRFETTTRPYLRGREFNFFETHDVFKTHEEALDQVRKDMHICEVVLHQKLGLPFLFVRRPQWDKFAGAADTYGAETIVDGKVNTIASTHDLGQGFAKAYNIRYTDETGMKDFAWQTTCGPGIIRIMAGLIGIHGDDQGLILPFEIAPVQIVIVPINYAGKDIDVTPTCKELEKKLAKKYRVKLDLSENTPGFKFNEWEMKGVPVRIEIGPKEVQEKKFTLVRRDLKKKEIVGEKELDKKIEELAAGLLHAIKSRAEQELRDSISTAQTIDETIKILNSKKGFVKAPFCFVDERGEKCAEELQEKSSGGKVRGTLFGSTEKPAGNCIVCGRKATAMVYIAKSY